MGLSCGCLERFLYVSNEYSGAELIMIKRSLNALIVLLLMFSGCGAAAQEAELEALARAYFEVVKTEGMASVSRFIHPDALEDFKEMALPIYEAEEATGNDQLRAMTFGSEATLADIRAAAPESFYDAFMNIIAAQTEGSQINFDKLEILGVVQEGEQRHVLTRISVRVDPVTLTQFEVLSYIPFEDSWKLKLNSEVEGLAAALASRLQ